MLYARNDGWSIGILFMYVIFMKNKEWAQACWVLRIHVFFHVRLGVSSQNIDEVFYYEAYMSN
jgi:hypothetical protein